MDGSVYYDTRTLQGMNALVMSYVDCAHYNGPANGLMSGELILFEDGRIAMQYDSFDENWEDLHMDSQTIGIRNSDGSIYLQADYNTAPAEYPCDGLAILFSVATPDASLSGHVYDDDTNAPISGAEVAVGGSSTTTDDNGYYELNNLVSGECEFTVTHSHYLTQNGITTLNPGANTLDCHLIYYNTEADFLILDVDDTPGSAAQIAAILNGLGFSTFYSTDWFEVPFEDYQAVFVFTGIYPNDFAINTGSAEETLCVNYLNSGGNFYLESGDNFAFTPPANLMAMLNLTGAADGAPDLFNVIAEDFMADADMTYAGENYYIDHIEPLNGAVRIFYNPSDGAGCGVVDNSLTYHTACFSFELGGLVDDDFTRADVVVGILDVFGMGAPEPVPFSLTPTSGIIPPGGGDVVYDAHLRSLVGATVSGLHYQTFVTLPNNQIFGPLVDFQFTLTPFMDRTVTGLTLHIPMTAPSGDYTFTGVAGFPDNPELQLSDSFPFTKIHPGTVAPFEFNSDDLVSNGRFIDGADPNLIPPTRVAMYETSPKPFNPVTTLYVTLPQESDLTITVFNVNGRQVAALADGKFPPGRHSFHFDGSGLASGIYFSRARIPGQPDSIPKTALLR